MDDPPASNQPVTGPVWGAVAPAGALTAAGLAARVGAYCWVEQQLFALLGGWVVEVPEPDVKLVIAEHADHAAWRAQRWYELLPTAPPGPDVLVVGPPAVNAALGALDPASDGPLPTGAKLAVAYRVVVPRLAAALRAHLDWSSPITEPAVGRNLRIALADLTEDWVVGERLLQALGPEDGPVGRSEPVVAGLDRAIAGAGGIVGSGSVGARTPGGGP